MPFLLIALVAAADAPRPARTPVTAAGRVSVQILQAARSSEKLWRAAPRRTERVVVDDQGRKYRLRTIDFE